MDTTVTGFIEQLAARGVARSFGAGQLLIREGDADGTLFLIRSGRVRVFSIEQDRQVLIDIHGPGAFIGEMALDGASRSASVEAIEAVEAVALERDVVLAFVRENPEFALSLIITLIQRARLATQNLKNVALRDVYGRLSNLLTGLASDVGGERVVTEPITQVEMARRVGSSREMVSKVYRDLVAGGYLRKERRGLVIARPLPKRW